MTHDRTATGMVDAERLFAMRDVAVMAEGRAIVEGVTFDLQRGQIVTLVGPNGSGKSTTAKLALGLVRPTTGVVDRKPGLRIGYVPQKLNVDRSLPLTVSRFMTLTERLTRAERREALTEAGALALENASVHDLSGGEMQRVLLARAIARKPDLLVLDEPAQGVDLSGEAAIYELIGRMRDRLGCGVLMVSHDLHLVMAATDRVICLNGHICCEGTPRAVVDNPAYRNLFGPRAGPALAVYRHDHDHSHEPDGTVHHHHHHHHHGSDDTSTAHGASRPASEADRDKREAHHAR